MKRLTPAVEAPYGTPLKMYTPFRLKPRIFPEVVSATVVASEAMTKPPPQPLRIDFVLEGASAMGCETALAGNIAELASPAANVAMPPMKERRSLHTDADSRFRGFFDVARASDFRLFTVTIPFCDPNRLGRGAFGISITEILYLSIKIASMTIWIDDHEHARAEQVDLQIFDTRVL